MDWQPDGAAGAGWGGASDNTRGETAAGNPAKRWRAHAGHGGCGRIASASHGPHLAPKAGPNDGRQGHGRPW